MVLSEIQEHLDGLLAEIESLPPIPQEAMSYSEMKMQLMVNYVANLAYYVSLKHRGVKVSGHPVFAHLAYLRTFIERLAPMDASLKYQIDKLLLEEEEDEEEADAARAGPNLEAFVPSVSSAVKKITVEQVRKQMNLDVGANSKMEIDPALIAAQILKAQTTASKPKKRKVKTYVEEDSESEREVAMKKKKGKAKKAADTDDEEIDSDDFE